MVNVLALNSDNNGGVGYFRCITPHLNINDSDVRVDIRMFNDHTLPLFFEQFISRYNIIWYNKFPLDDNKLQHFYNLCHKYNIKIVFDIDDYFILSNDNPNYKSWKNNNLYDKTINHIKKADVVTTTTEIFAEELRKINPNVVVLANAINIKEHQWTSNKIQSDKNRFLWGGGVTHKADLFLMKEDIKKIDKDFLKSSQLYMCGFDLGIRDIKTGNVRKDEYQRSPWNHFEHVFTNDNKYIDMDYYSYLKSSSNFDNDNLFGYNETFIDRFYQRRHTKPVTLYGTMYNEGDVALAPIKNNTFNKYKSQLKVIEAGCHKMPIIASDFGPYTLDDIDGKKGFLIKNTIGWYDKMKWYSENKNAIIEHGLANHEHFLNNYEIQVVNKKRIELYKYIGLLEKLQIKL